MPNLYVFDKDGTLVHHRKDGYVGHPEDQILYEGVRDKLDRLRSDGHVLAIASNQGGCDYHEVGAERLLDGSSFAIEDDEGIFAGDFFTVLSIDTDDHGLINVETSSQDFTFSKGEPVLMQYKTIKGAIAEMEFAADLCGIREAYFAPTMDGKSIVILDKPRDRWHHQIETPSPESKYSFGGFRKPQPGMLLMPSYGYKYDRRIMIGDLDSDRQAAIAAGFEFIWAEVFRNAQE